MYIKGSNSALMINARNNPKKNLRIEIITYFILTPSSILGSGFLVIVFSGFLYLIYRFILIRNKTEFIFFFHFFIASDSQSNFFLDLVDLVYVG